MQRIVSLIIGVGVLVFAVLATYVYVHANFIRASDFRHIRTFDLVVPPLLILGVAGFGLINLWAGLRPHNRFAQQVQAVVAATALICIAVGTAAAMQFSVPGVLASVPVAGIGLSILRTAFSSPREA